MSTDQPRTKEQDESSAHDPREDDPPPTERELLRQLFDAMPQLGWTAQPDGYIDYYNRGWYEYTGTTYEQMKGWGWRSVHHPDELPRVMETWTHSIATGKAWELAVPLRRKDGVFRWFLSRATPIYDRQGRLVRWVGINTDIDDQKRSERALAELDCAKTAFFSNVSHEFRTPLTLMLGPIEEALRESDGPLSREQLEVVHRNGLRLQRLVNTLLDFSRLEAGRARASYEPTDLAALTVDLASTFRSAVEKAGLALVVDAPALEQPVFVDRDMWEKIVLNLLSNALKFTFQGSIRVALREAATTVDLLVTDTGTGIPETELPRLFERFHRIEGAHGRTHEGSGIGLALVHELVKLHQGTIVVESSLGHGTTFRIRLPKGRGHLPVEHVRAEVVKASRSTRAQAYVEEALRWLPEGDTSRSTAGLGRAAQAEATGGLEGKRPLVLVADDNADMRDYVRRLLAGLYDVEVVADGEAALAAVAQRAPDLVLSDIMMPRLDGFGLVERLRSSPATSSIPVIFLSARAGEEASIEGRKAGADDYLVKPFRARELVARVESQLTRARVRRETEGTLRASASALREADRRKDEFLAMLAHELRNPLAPIQMAVQLLRARGSHAETVVRARDVIGRQVDQLARLVDDLLEVSRITSGKIHLRPELTDVQTIVVRAVETSRPLLAARRHKLTLTLPDGPVRLEADPTRLAQVVSNLLNNAAKYTDPGGKIWLTVEEERGEVALRVRDTGIGIAPEMLDRVFELFVQADRSLDRSQGGLGLGLTLVRSIVQLHGGTVSARSEGRGKGSEFVVLLRAAPEGAARGSASAAVAADSRRRRVLVVDDNHDAAETLGELLATFGHEVKLAFDGETALEIAGGFSPEAVFLDIGLPRIDGYEVARRLRASYGRTVVLAALTGYGQEEDRHRATEAGFDRHIVKPPGIAEIEAALAACAELTPGPSPASGG